MIDCRLDEILEMLNGGDVLGPAAFEDFDFEKAASSREISYSPSHRRYDYASGGHSELFHRWRILPVHRDLKELHQKIVRTAYEIAHRYTSRFDDHRFELSNYISQELDWIAQSRALEWENEWLDSIWSVYKVNRIPMPPWVGVPES